MKCSVIYHDDCVDGFTSAFIAKKALDSMGADFHLHGWKHSDPDPDPILFEGQTVFILDFSFKRQTMDRINQMTDQLLVLDHHESTKNRCEDAPYAVFDMDKSGARMTWDFFFEGSDPPDLVRYVEDADLWNWELEHSRAVNAAISSYDFDFDHWSDWMSDEGYWPSEDSKGRLAEEGEAILRFQEEQIKHAIERAEPVVIDGYEALAVNSSVLVSKIGNELAKRAEGSIGITWHVRGDEIKFSIRSTRPDVSEIAANRGGGGHPKAAAWTVPRTKQHLTFLSRL